MGVVTTPASRVQPELAALMVGPKEGLLLLLPVVLGVSEGKLGWPVAASSVAMTGGSRETGFSVLARLLGAPLGVVGMGSPRWPLRGLAVADLIRLVR